MTNPNGYLNAIDFFTRNKHSDYPEVVFSSVLSNLLDPKIEYVFSDELIKYFYKKFLPNMNFELGELFAEYSLGIAGNIDIFYQTSNSVLGIEVKIWDRSAKNVDQFGTSQLLRYANEISKLNKNWILIYVVPNLSSPICRKEFYEASKLYPNNLIILPWNNEIEEQGNNKDSSSILDILDELKNYVKKDQISQWIYNSLIESIPYLVEQIPDPKKFPNKDELGKTNIWMLYNEFCNYYNKFPNPLHTTIGMPISTGSNKSKIHRNCLFRIRTTKNYYYKNEEKQNFLPSDFLELELWIDIYDEVKNELNKLFSKYNLEIEDDYHLDKVKRTKIKLLRIHREINLDNFLPKFDSVLRNGVRILEEKV